MGLIRVLLLCLLLALPSGCVSRQIQESKTETVTEVVAEQATVSTVTESTQDAVQSDGANVRGEVENVTTVNEDGIPVHWFIIGALIFGIIIPQPRVIKWLF
jgi:hypothetical protein